ncbi:N-6 DNA methylase [Actinomadura sp. NPDC048394]|jgi:type I restriction enzyme M protein|uniref:N-6 DNA methylase n=1 Tax=Actinomadura sp. NPDC048394 TaxID=3158223 RepID=UPI00340EC97F
MNAKRVSLADIARRAGVQRPAASNWKRRHHDFPDPLEGTSGELFDAAEVAAWLDCRRIPVNALRPGERPGTTFGDRFRGAAGTAVAEQEARKPPVTERADAAARIWKVFDGVRGFADLGDFTESVLALVCCRAVDPRGFEWFRDAVRSVPPSGAGDLFLSAWAGVSRRTAMRLDDPPVLRDVGGGKALAAVAEILYDMEPPAEDDRGNPWWGPSEMAGVYEAVLGRIAVLEGHRGGEFHTPRSVVRTMVEMVDPAVGERVHDPCCGTGGMLAGVIRHARGNAPPTAPPPDVSGASLTERGRRLAAMNLLVHGVRADVRSDALAEVGARPEGRRFDAIVTNPPFTLTLAPADLGGLHWRYGEPPARNVSFAWLQSVLAMLSDRGRAALVTANGATFSRHRSEHMIRAAMIEDGVVDCVVALPPRLFASTGIPVSLWILRKDGAGNGRILLIDAGELGDKRSRAVRTLTDDDVGKISGTYRAWREGRFRDEPGFARGVGLDELRARGHSLSPPTYMTSTAVEADMNAAKGDVERLRADLARLHVRLADLDEAVDRLLGGGR